MHNVKEFLTNYGDLVSPIPPEDQLVTTIDRPSEEVKNEAKKSKVKQSLFLKIKNWFYINMPLSITSKLVKDKEVFKNDLESLKSEYDQKIDEMKNDYEENLNTYGEDLKSYEDIDTVTSFNNEIAQKLEKNINISEKLGSKIDSLNNQTNLDNEMPKIDADLKANEVVSQIAKEININPTENEETTKLEPMESDSKNNDEKAYDSNNNSFKQKYQDLECHYNELRQQFVTDFTKMQEQYASSIDEMKKETSLLIGFMTTNTQKQMNEMQEQISQLQATINTKDKEIANLNSNIQSKELLIEQQKQQLEEKSSTISNQEVTMKNQEETIQAKDKSLNSANAEIMRLTQIETQYNSIRSALGYNQPSQTETVKTK